MATYSDSPLYAPNQVVTSAGATSVASAFDSDPTTYADFPAIGPSCPSPTYPTTPPTGSPQVVPQVTGSAPLPIAYFGSGANYPAGCYQIIFVAGGALWNVASSIWAMDSYVTDGQGNQVLFTASGGNYPGHSNWFTSQALLDQAMVGRGVAFSHNGGQIGMQCSDGYAVDNGNGSPNPTFALIGPIAVSQVTVTLPYAATIDHVVDVQTNLLEGPLNSSSTPVITANGIYALPDGVQLTVAFPSGARTNSGNCTVGLSFPSGAPAGSYQIVLLDAQNAYSGYSGSFTLSSALPPVSGYGSASKRFIAADWGAYYYVDRIRIKTGGAGGSNAGIALLTSDDVFSGETTPDQAPATYFPSISEIGPDAQGVYDLVLPSPVYARGAAFFPDAQISAGQQPQSLPEVQLYQFGIYTGAPLIMAYTGPAPTVTHARINCSGFTIYPWIKGDSYAAVTAAGNVANAIGLQGLQTLDFEFDSTTEILRGGESKRALAAYETQQDLTGKIAFERADYRYLWLCLGGNMSVVAANANGPEQQLFIPTRPYAGYFTFVAVSNNGDGNERIVVAKAKISGKATRSTDRTKLTQFELPFVVVEDPTWVNQDGTVGGYTEMVYTDGADAPLHS